MKRGDKVYKIEVNVDNCGNIDYKVKGGICIEHSSNEIVVNYNRVFDTNVGKDDVLWIHNNACENDELWYDSSYYALINFKRKLESILKSVDADLNAISEGWTTYKLEEAEK